MFINFTNHPSVKWSAEQIDAARQYGEVIDIPFPAVDPQGGDDYIAKLAVGYAAEILSLKPTAVLCQGEMTLSFAIALILMRERGVTVLTACSNRAVTETTGADGKTVKQAEFKFTGFRKYIREI